VQIIRTEDALARFQADIPSMKKTFGRLSYANVMSTIAVFAALGGGAYAATALPKNSVGAAQIKKNAVASAKVKDRSLLAKDFKAGQLPAGAKGDNGAAGEKGEKGEKGEQGAQGIQGIQGIQGVQGERGPSDGFVSANNSGTTTVGAGAEDVLGLPAGDFVVNATADVENGVTGAAGSVTCQLKAAGLPIDTSVVELAADGAPVDHGTVALSGAVHFNSTNNVSVDCANTASAGQLVNLDIQAVQVADITADEIV
jgi:hypothetical protein